MVDVNHPIYLGQTYPTLVFVIFPSFCFFKSQYKRAFCLLVYPPPPLTDRIAKKHREKLKIRFKSIMRTDGSVSKYVRIRRPGVDVEVFISLEA